MSSPEMYGSRYWCIRYDENDTFVYADSIEVTGSGALVAWGSFRADPAEQPDERIPVYGVAAGRWDSFWAASQISGSAVAMHPD